MNAPAMEELSRLRAIAEEGRSRPLLGGRHLILWGSAIIVALLINWAVAERLVDWPGWSLAISWFGIMLAAWAASALLDRSKALERGASSVGNRVERAAWVTTGAFLMILSLALLARSVAAAEPEAWQYFAILSPAMFGAYAVALQVSSIASGAGDARFPVATALFFCAVTAFLIGSPVQYLAAAAGVALVAIPAGLRQLAAERRAG